MAAGIISAFILIRKFNTKSNGKLISICCLKDLLKNVPPNFK